MSAPPRTQFVVVVTDVNPKTDTEAPEGRCKPPRPHIFATRKEAEAHKCAAIRLKLETLAEGIDFENLEGVIDEDLWEREGESDAESDDDEDNTDNDYTGWIREAHRLDVKKLDAELDAVMEYAIENVEGFENSSFGCEIYEEPIPTLKRKAEEAAGGEPESKQAK